MKVLMTGGTGFVGSFLTDRLVRDGHEVTLLVRDNGGIKTQRRNIAYVPGGPNVPGPWQQAVMNHDVIINLVGASIFTRWTPEQKKIIRESRLATTRNIVEGIDTKAGRAATLISTSAVGYYGFHEDEELAEDAPAGHDFLATVARQWEEEAMKAQQKGARVCIARFGTVLGPNGGALGQLIPLFKRFVGGPVGSGKQWLSWVHIDDLTEAILFLINRPDLSGPFNLCSPRPVRNGELAKAIGKALHRPSFLPAPGFMVRLVLGEFGSVVLKGQRVVPRRLMESGFRFKHADIYEAIESIVRP